MVALGSATKLMTEKPNTRDHWTVQRLLGLFVGFWYLYGMVRILAVVTHVSVVLAVPVVCVAAGIIMAVMVVFGVKAYRQEGPVRQFRLSSLFLLVIPLSIYFAAIRLLIGTVPPEIGLIAWSAIGLASLFFIIISTVVLLWLAETLMWLAVLLIRTVNRLRHIDSDV